MNLQLISSLLVALLAICTPLKAAEVSTSTSLAVTVNVVDVVLNDEHRQGVDWDAIVADYHTISLRKPDNPIWQDKKYQLSVGTVSAEDYSVLIDALDTVGVVAQHPIPPASIDVGQMQDVAVADDKVRLRLNPTLQNDEMKLAIEALLTYIVYDPKYIGREPTMLELKAETVLKLEDKTTIVLGGFFHEQEIAQTHKIPLLGDLPLLGLVFRSHGRLMQKSEKIIFITLTKQGS